MPPVLFFVVSSICRHGWANHEVEYKYEIGGLCEPSSKIRSENVGHTGGHFKLPNALTCNAPSTIEKMLGLYLTYHIHVLSYKLRQFT